MKLRNKQLLIEITNLCDAHCVICPRELFKAKPKTMDMRLFTKIIDDAVQHDIDSIDTCGFGEVFLDNHLFDKLAYIRGRLPGANIFVSTTGFHMDPEKHEDVKRYIDTLKLSVYGATKETYETFHRGKLKFEKSMGNISALLESKNGAPRTVGLFVETVVNSHEKFDWLRMWEGKLDEVFVWKPHNWVQGRSYREVDMERQTTCGRPDNGPMYIHADGTVGPCCWDIHGDIYLGDLNFQTIEEVYRGEPYRRLREAHKIREFGDYICQNCDQTNFDPSVLVYKSNPDRKVGQLTANMKGLV